MLLNISNHPFGLWLENQMAEALQQYGSVEDLPFPSINPGATGYDLDQLVKEYEIKIREINPTAAHIMGELTFTYRLVNKLKAISIPCIASTTERIATIEGNGNKTSTFRFVKFREY